MATVDLLTNTNSKRPFGFAGHGADVPFVSQGARLDWNDVKSTGTKKIFILPAKSTVIFCWFIVETAFTSGGSATMEIVESSGVGVIIDKAEGPVADMSKGSVIKGVSADSTSAMGLSAGDDAEYDTSERTIDFDTGTAAFTAGLGVLLATHVTLMV